MLKNTKFTCVSESLCKCLGNLGRNIARHPYYYIIVPSIVCALLCIGFFNMKIIHDINYLLCADRGNIFDIRQFIDKTFPMNTSEFYDLQRISHRPVTPMIYIKHKKHKNMLHKNILLEVQMLTEIANNVTVYVDERQIGYKDVCGRIYEKCFENPISTLLNRADDVLSKRLKFKYPIDIDPLTFSYKIMLFNLGGVIVDKNDYIQEVYAMRLFYPLDYSNTSKTEWTKAWSKALHRRIKECNFKYIDTFLEPFASTDVNVMSDLQEIIPFISVTIIVVCLFSMLSNMTNSWIRSKPWMGVASVMSAGMAVAASFGLLFACGVESTYYNVALPFAILVTEVDDSFVVIACWRTTNTRDSVEKRMEDTLSFSIWGIISLNEGFDVFGVYPENSEITRAFRVYYKYFTEYPFTIHIVIKETLDYSHEFVQKSLDDMMEKFQSHPNVADMDISWLKYFKDFQQHSAAKYSFMGYDLSTKQDFIDALRNVFLKFPGAKHYENDI
ncbi:patched domain-containing protein 3-like, partial [Centruroides sculpturatus]|uniref:patched domain-containing protein 3-like n=1 Tax=Centruroides sculpturatus TaxID=218467 RepID=UPI000C6E5DA0